MKNTRIRRFAWVLLAILSLFATERRGAAAAEKCVGPSPKGSFSVVVISDSQKYRGRGTKMQPDSTNEVTNVSLDSHARWIAANIGTQRIAFVTHVGDIVDRNVPEQWAVAKRCMDRLHGLVPYGIASGNHDMGASGDASLFVENFGAKRFAGMGWFGGVFPGGQGTNATRAGASSFQLFSAAGLNFVILHLECNAPNDVLAWADGVLRTHAKRRAIVTTHMGLGPLQKPKNENDFFDSPKGRMQWKKIHGQRGNTPQEMWDKFFKRHDNIFLILNGDQSRTQAMRLVSKSDHGKPIYELLSDYNMDRDDLLRVCRFLPASNRVEIITFDSNNGALCSGTKLVPDPGQHRFALDYPMVTGQKSSYEKN